jgi:hypothetical protein
MTNDNYVNYHIENAVHFKIMGNAKLRNAHVRAAALAIDATDAAKQKVYLDFVKLTKIKCPVTLS